jgi:hypothetical protein
LSVPDEPPTQVIPGEPAEGILKDVLGILRGPEPEDEISVELLSMALV